MTQIDADICIHFVYTALVQSDQFCIPKEGFSDSCISLFKGTFLSNFYTVDVVYNDFTFPSVEHAYLKQKFDLEYIDVSIAPEQKEVIQEELSTRGHSIYIDSFTNIFDNPVYTSGNVKVITRHLVKLGYEDPERDQIKLPIMIDLVWQKFANNEDLKKKLLDTGVKYLLEGNDRGDVYRGRSDGRGKNYLGRLLMIVRGILDESIHVPEFKQ